MLNLNASAAAEDVARAESQSAPGLAPRWQLPEGRNGATASRSTLRAAHVQLKQGTTAAQLDDVLEELFECLELSYTVCPVKQLHQ